MDQLDNPAENQKKALTSIRGAYTLSRTPALEGEEVDQIMVRNFLNILAEVAINIAARRNSHEQSGNQESN
jgi:hypothetical protein